MIHPKSRFHDEGIELVPPSDGLLHLLQLIREHDGQGGLHQLVLCRIFILEEAVEVLVDEVGVHVAEDELFVLHEVDEEAHVGFQTGDLRWKRWLRKGVGGGFGEAYVEFD